MTFKYEWCRKAANFGKPIEEEIAGGTRFTIENMLTFEQTPSATKTPPSESPTELQAIIGDISVENALLKKALSVWD